jgi:uncharacterized membrane protein YkgB
MLRRFLGALRVALRDQEFGRVVGAAVALVVVGTLAYTFGEDWSVVDGFYVAVATLTTSSVLDPDLSLTQSWLKIFTAFYVLVGIGILVEVARRLGMGFIVFRQEEAARKAEDKARKAAASESGDEA